MKFSKFPVEVRIAIFYAIFGGIWILLSDSFLGELAPDYTLYARLQTYKGWFFVAASALLIFSLIKREIAMRVETTERLRASEEQYRKLFEHMTEGYAYCKMLFEHGQAVDWVYLNVNGAFETLTGLKEVTGKRVSEIIPSIRTSDPELFQIYSRVATTAKPEKFEIFLQALKMWFSISVYSPEREHFVAVFDVITERKQAEEALRRFELLSEHSRDMILFMRREDGRILEANSAAMQAYGYSHDELLALRIQDLRASGTKDLTADQMTQADSEGILFETVHLRKDGCTFPVEVSSQGATIGGLRTLVSIVRDITTRKQAEDALRESEERLRLSLYAANQGLYDLNVQTGVAIVNEEYARMLGYDPETFVETNAAWIERLHPDDQAATQKAYLDYIDGMLPEYRVEFRQKTKDGDWKWILSLGKVVEYDPSGKPLRMLGTHTDITEHKQAEETLRKKEGEIRSLYESMTELFVLHEVIYDATGKAVDYRILECNPAFEKITGIRRIEVVGGLASKVYGTGEAPYLDIYASVAETGKPVDFETQFSPMGKHLHISVFSAESGYFATLASDITERKRAEEELHQILDELKHSNAELEQFAYVASHDLQEPLRGIAGIAQLLQQRYHGQLDNQADEFINHIVDGTQRMQTLINDLLAYSRIGRRGESIRSVQVEAALKATMENLNVAILEYRATITNDSLPTVKADATQLIQLFQNLIGNAIKFRADRPPEIHIGVTDEGNFWQFSVCDNGIGIEPQYFERIFQVFQRLHTRREYKGTGIGLAICKKIIERHGGRIWVESQIGQGSSFYFTLPKGN